MKRFILFALLLNSIAAAAQDKNTESIIIRKGLVSSQLTLAPGFMLHEKITNIYLHGALEYFLAKNVSVCGEGYAFLGSHTGKGILKHNHTLLFGMAYHIVKGNFEAHVGFMPGAALTQIHVAATPESAAYDTRFALSPIISINTGVSYYVTKHMHFFADVRYVTGLAVSNAIKPLHLDEIRISAGLGFNLNVLKLKQTFKSF